MLNNVSDFVNKLLAKEIRFQKGWNVGVGGLRPNSVFIVGQN